MLDLNQICFVHKFISNKLPPSFDDFFVKLPNFDRNLSLSLTSVRNKKIRNFPSYAMPLIWNSLPLQTKRITSINTLKKNYAASLISKYTTKCNNANCFSCHNWILSIWTWPSDICFFFWFSLHHVCLLCCLAPPTTPPQPPPVLDSSGVFVLNFTYSYWNRDKK